MNNVTAIILAGGIGSRMNTDKTKQNIVISGKTILQRSLDAFCLSHLVSDIVIVARSNEIDDIKQLVSAYNSKQITVVEGGHTRAHSAANGFSAIGYDSNFVAIHDSARCLITPDMIDTVIQEAFKCGAATAVCAVTDTVKIVNNEGFICDTLPRDNVYRAQTPQVFSVSIYRKALYNSLSELDRITDDNMLVEKIGEKISCVNLGWSNIKITTSEDIGLAEFILSQRGE